MNEHELTVPVFLGVDYSDTPEKIPDNKLADACNVVIDLDNIGYLRNRRGDIGFDDLKTAYYNGIYYPAGSIVSHPYVSGTTTISATYICAKDVDGKSIDGGTTFREPNTAAGVGYWWMIYPLTTTVFKRIGKVLFPMPPFPMSVTSDIYQTFDAVFIPTGKEFRIYSAFGQNKPSPIYKMDTALGTSGSAPVGVNGQCIGYYMDSILLGDYNKLKFSIAGNSEVKDFTIDDAIKGLKIDLRDGGLHATIDADGWYDQGEPYNGTTIMNCVLDLETTEPIYNSGLNLRHPLATEGRRAYFYPADPSNQATAESQPIIERVSGLDYKTPYGTGMMKKHGLSSTRIDQIVMQMFGDYRWKKRAGSPFGTYGSSDKSIVFETLGKTIIKPIVESPTATAAQKTNSFILTNYSNNNSGGIPEFDQSTVAGTAPFRNYWEPSTVYSVNDVVIAPSIGRVYQCTSSTGTHTSGTAGAQPTWSRGKTMITPDAAYLQWKEIATDMPDLQRSLYWSPSTNYDIANDGGVTWIRSKTHKNAIFRMKTGTGITGTVEPNFDITAQGALTEDHDITWETFLLYPGFIEVNNSDGTGFIMENCYTIQDSYTGMYDLYFEAYKKQDDRKTTAGYDTSAIFDPTYLYPQSGTISLTGTREKTLSYSGYEYFPATDFFLLSGFVTKILPMSLKSATQSIISACAIFTENSIYSLVGDPRDGGYLNMISDTIGLKMAFADTVINTPHGIIFANETNVFVLGQDSAPQPIGNEIRKWLNRAGTAHAVNSAPSFNSCRFTASYDLKTDMYKLCVQILADDIWSARESIRGSQIADLHTSVSNEAGESGKDAGYEYSELNSDGYSHTIYFWYHFPTKSWWPQSKSLAFISGGVSNPSNAHVDFWNKPHYMGDVSEYGKTLAVCFGGIYLEDQPKQLNSASTHYVGGESEIYLDYTDSTYLTFSIKSGLIDETNWVANRGWVNSFLMTKKYSAGSPEIYKSWVHIVCDAKLDYVGQLAMSIFTDRLDVSRYNAGMINVTDPTGNQQIISNHTLLHDLSRYLQVGISHNRMMDISRATYHDCYYNMIATTVVYDTVGHTLDIELPTNLYDRYRLQQMFTRNQDPTGIITASISVGANRTITTESFTDRYAVVPGTASSTCTWNTNAFRLTNINLGTGIASFNGTRYVDVISNDRGIVGTTSDMGPIDTFLFEWTGAGAGNLAINAIYDPAQPQLTSNLGASPDFQSIVGSTNGQIIFTCSINTTSGNSTTGRTISKTAIAGHFIATVSGAFNVGSNFPSVWGCNITSLIRVLNGVSTELLVSDSGAAFTAVFGGTLSPDMTGTISAYTNTGFNNQSAYGNFKIAKLGLGYSPSRRIERN